MLSRESLRPPRHAWAGNATRGVCNRGPAGEPASPPCSLQGAANRHGAGSRHGARPLQGSRSSPWYRPVVTAILPQPGGTGPQAVLATRGSPTGRGWPREGTGGFPALGDGSGKPVGICVGRAAPVDRLLGRALPGVAVGDTSRGCGCAEDRLWPSSSSCASQHPWELRGALQKRGMDAAGGVGRGFPSLAMDWARRCLACWWSHGADAWPSPQQGFCRWAKIFPPSPIWSWDLLCTGTVPTAETQPLGGGSGRTTRSPQAHVGGAALLCGQHGFRKYCLYLFFFPLFCLCLLFFPGTMRVKGLWQGLPST